MYQGRDAWINRYTIVEYVDVIRSMTFLYQGPHVKVIV